MPAMQNDLTAAVVERLNGCCSALSRCINGGCSSGPARRSCR
ncbi:MAG TPA: hypothetical protein P5175_13245 [Anaerohalosphaeraceae bacterium]|nr:hypothetical protein [Anaerohalosphaeraceae bacterium]HPO71002.1 hypothetical protein [Anaerohalosphaeraceae bacterium]HRS72800.1 hypothetical protein [Anaerohalosphaeraceae bacterium]HRV21299.1 hypothetical protein [Anaerohalosphaeraceae bacterium]